MPVTYVEEEQVICISVQLTLHPEFPPECFQIVNLELTHLSCTGKKETTQHMIKFKTR